jgi:hypothetical protein
VLGKGVGEEDEKVARKEKKKKDIQDESSRDNVEARFCSSELYRSP